MNILSTLNRFGPVLTVGAILAITGCGSSGGGGSASTGALSLQITDGPVDTAEHVYIQFSGLELQGEGQRTTLYYCEDPVDSTKAVVSDTACTTPAAPKQIDLLALSGGQADFLLDGFMLPSGHYSWIRLIVDTDGTRDSYIVVQGGAEHELTIPSGNQTGLKLNQGFDVPAGGSANFTIDFDLRKSVHVTGNGTYMLRPTLRLVNNTMVGSISGTVDPSLIPSDCSPAVYVFSGTGATPDDIDTDNTYHDPVTTASVNPTDGTYRAAFLEAGDYTIAYTCDAAADDPTIDDTLSFSGTTTVPVAANATTTHDF